MSYETCEHGDPIDECDYCAGDEAAAATLRELEKLRSQLATSQETSRRLLRLCSKVIVIATLQPGEELADNPGHAVTDAALSLKRERDASQETSRGLREALERIRAYTATTWESVAINAREVARAALAAPGSPGAPAVECPTRSHCIECGDAGCMFCGSPPEPPKGAPAMPPSWSNCQWCGNQTREGEREFCPAWPGTEQKCHEGPTKQMERETVK